MDLSTAACQCSRMTPENRKNCGFPGITSDECFDNGCCFDSSVGGVPWCFHPLPNQGKFGDRDLFPAVSLAPVPGQSLEQVLGSQAVCLD